MGILEFALIALSLFYIVTAIYSLIRLIKVCSSENVVKISISFYSGMLIASVSRAIGLYLISIYIISPQDSTKDEDTALNIFIYLMIIIPDLGNICVYLFLIWYFWANFILSHINLANDLSLFSKEDEPTMSGKTYLMLYITIPAYFVFFVLICILTFTKVIEREVLFMITSYFSLITPILFVAYYIFLLVKFSGRPYINAGMKEQVTKIFIIVCIWSIARMVIGILGLIASGSFFDRILNEFEKESNNTLFAVSILIYFIVSEFIPNFFALDYSFMMTYIKFNKTDDLIKTDSEYNQNLHSETLLMTPRRMSKNSSDLNSNYFALNLSNNISINNQMPNKKSINDFMVKKFNDIQLIQSKFQRKNGLGIIFKSKFQDKDVACRVIKFDRLSRYDLEGLSKDMEEIMNLSHPNICSVTEICLENLPNIYIMTNYFNKGSLYDVLHVQKTQLSLKERIKIAKEIAVGLQFLHENKIYHLHLSSKNILIQEENFTPCIADFGFHYLKDISSVFIKYKNKNSYSSPELLKDTNNIASGDNNINFKSDVYSFGILLWELYTLTIPFNVSLNLVYDYVVVNGYRPEITNDFNPEIASLIRLCWDENPSKRPEFKTIIDKLENSKI